MAFFAIAATVVSTGLSIYGQRQATKAAEQQAEFQAETAEMTAKWNADQATKQANYEEGIAQENMRRKRLNNRRELARRRATGARSGLKETGAVADVLVDTSERLQQDVDDIWDKASTRSSQLYGEAGMALWQGDMKSKQIAYGSKAAQQASKYAIYGTAIKGAGSIAGLAHGAFGGGSTPKPNPNQTTPLKALPYNPYSKVSYSGK